MCYLGLIILGHCTVRRSRRDAVVSDNDSENEIEPQIHKRHRNEWSRATYLDPNRADNDVVDVADPNADAIALFSILVLSKPLGRMRTTKKSAVTRLHF
jgi:hypothetical protein